MESTKQDRMLEIFFRCLRGEDISVQNLANEYGVSTKSISRNITDLKSFLADHRDLVGNTELQYSHQNKTYLLYMDEFLTNKELFSLVEVIIGARAFSKMELLALTDKLKRFTTTEDRPKLNELIRKELYHYAEVKHDCESVQERLWQIVNCVADHKEISIDYYRMDRTWVTHRVRPASVMFTDYYFYMIAFMVEGSTENRIISVWTELKILQNIGKDSLRIPYRILMKVCSAKEAFLCGRANCVPFVLHSAVHRYRRFLINCQLPE